MWHFEAYVRDRWVKAHAESLPPKSWVLDAGAGSSKYHPFFRHCRYETQDFCKYDGPLVSYSEPVNYVSDITAIPLPDQCLDAILCTEVIEHVVDPIAVFKEFSRLLKPSGKLLLTAPLLSNLHMEPFHYFGGFTPHFYRHWLPQFEFRVEEIQPVGGPGRTCVVFVQVFYEAWTAAEFHLRPLPKLLSRSFRMLAKIPAHLLLPRTLPLMDPWLGNHVTCSGYMVLATRIPK
jgi:SAM-dependent methyltransferase